MLLVQIDRAWGRESTLYQRDLPLYGLANLPLHGLPTPARKRA